MAKKKKKKGDLKKDVLPLDPEALDSALPNEDELHMHLPEQYLPDLSDLAEEVTSEGEQTVPTASLDSSDSGALYEEEEPTVFPTGVASNLAASVTVAIVVGATYLACN